MELTITRNAENADVTLIGSFTFNDNPKFKTILELTEDGTVKSINCNFARVDFVDSAALGMLMMLRAAAANKNQSVSLSDVKGQVEKIFKLSKFDTMFHVHYSK